MDNGHWENMFEIAKQYYEENGDLLISSKYVTIIYKLTAKII